MAAEFPKYRVRSLQDIQLQDLKNMQDDKGNIITNIIDVLKEENEILQDIRFQTANKGTDRYWATSVISYPKSWWSRYNRGVPTSKGSYASIEETCGRLETASAIDARMADEQDNARAFRYMQDKLHLAALNRDMAEYLFYGDKSVAPEGFDGFASRYNTLNVNETVSKNVIDCGGKGKNLSSIYLINLSDGCFAFTPKGVPAGIQYRDGGRTTFFDENNYPFEKYVSYYSWSLGLCIPDWRSVVRLCNIDVDQLMNGEGIGNPDMMGAGQNLLLLMQRAIGLVSGARSLNNNSRIAFYMNNDVLSGLNGLSLRANSRNIRIQDGMDQYGTPANWGSFNGIPLRRVDRIKSVEEKVKAQGVL